MSGLSGCALKPEAFRDVVQSALQILTSSRSSSSFESETRASGELCTHARCSERKRLLAGHEAEVLRILALAAYERWSESQCKQACATVRFAAACAVQRVMVLIAGRPPPRARRSSCSRVERTGQAGVYCSKHIN